ncbi:MAG: enoyl-CoA hydratase/isomerase family protein [Candidatus Jordarchaeum sp.]|uniref:enoyl-CoA hydratase/isomerase family protein n=1 Tax=Candidatus Jordarchaeum sp. TaxID=2823881 RepID=UPI00404A9E61
MGYETIIYEKKNGVGKITLNRPEKLNAMNFQMVDDLVGVLDDISNDDEVRAVIITGAGRAFCSGAELAELGAREDPFESLSFMRSFAHRPILALRSLEKPVVAAVNGYALGIGCGIALACDIRIASEDAVFGERFVRIGILPGDGDMYLLPLLIGLGRASELLFTGDDLSGKEAERIGLANRCVPTDKLIEEAEALAQRLAQGATRAIAAIKSALNRRIIPELKQELDYTNLQQSLLYQTEDHNEALKAIKEKRKPVFKGR